MRPSYKVYPQCTVTTYSVSLLLNEDKDGADILYSLNQTLRLLFIPLHNFVRLLFESGCYSFQNVQDNATTMHVCP